MTHHLNHLHHLVKLHLVKLALLVDNLLNCEINNWWHNKLRQFYSSIILRLNVLRLNLNSGYCFSEISLALPVRVCPSYLLSLTLQKQEFSNCGSQLQD